MGVLAKSLFGAAAALMGCLIAARVFWPPLVVGTGIGLALNLAFLFVLFLAVTEWKRLPLGILYRTGATLVLVSTFVFSPAIDALLDLQYIKWESQDLPLPAVLAFVLFGAVTLFAWYLLVFRTISTIRDRNKSRLVFSVLFIFAVAALFVSHYARQ